MPAGSDPDFKWDKKRLKGYQEITISWEAWVGNGRRNTSWQRQRLAYQIIRDTVWYPEEIAVCVNG